MSEVEARKQSAVNLSGTPVWITDDLVFLGEIPRQYAFERADPKKRRFIHRMAHGNPTSSWTIPLLHIVQRKELLSSRAARMRVSGMSKSTQGKSAGIRM